MILRKLAQCRIIAVLALCLAPAAFAEDIPDLSGADAAAGEALYAQQCVACHGPAGNSVVPTQPILSGQHPEYLYEQLEHFRSGYRQNAVMAGFAANLTDEDIANLAVYLSTQEPVLSGVSDEGLARAGEQLYRSGDAERGVPACTACHGPAGAGIPPIYPRLSGQHAAYTAAALKEFRSGARKNEVMAGVSAQLTDDEIAALAEYISGLYY